MGQQKPQNTRPNTMLVPRMPKKSPVRIAPKVQNTGQALHMMKGKGKGQFNRAPFNSSVQKEPATTTGPKLSKATIFTARKR